MNRERGGQVVRNALVPLYYRAVRALVLLAKTEASDSLKERC